MDLNYKSCDDFLLFVQKDIAFANFSLDLKDDPDLMIAIFQLFKSLKDFSDPFDFDNLLKTGCLIIDKLQHINDDLHQVIFSYEKISILHLLSNLVANQETYSKNNHLIYIVFSIICQVLKTYEIDISIFSTHFLIDTIFNFSIPNMRKNDPSTLILPAITLVNEILESNTVSFDFFFEGHYIEILISDFDSMVNADQMKTCEIFNQIITNYEFDQKVDFLEDSSFFFLKNFIEDKMFYFPKQPFYVLDLISNSIKKEFVSLRKLYAIQAYSIEEIIQELIDDKESLFKMLESILKPISAAFSTKTDSEESEEFISNFQWSFFIPFLPFISSGKEEFNSINDDFQMTLCNTFSYIFKRSRFLAESCKNELNLLNILLNIASSSSEFSYKVKEASINALMNLIMTDHRIVFYIGDKKEPILINDYLYMLIEFLESNSNDIFLQSVINSILYITICAEYKCELRSSQMILKSEENIDDAFNEFVDEFIIASLLECEENLREKIESAFSSIQMSNGKCQELLMSLQRHLQNFYQITKQ